MHNLTKVTQLWERAVGKLNCLLKDTHVRVVEPGLNSRSDSTAHTIPLPLPPSMLFISH